MSVFEDKTQTEAGQGITNDVPFPNVDKTTPAKIRYVSVDSKEDGLSMGKSQHLISLDNDLRREEVGEYVIDIFGPTTKTDNLFNHSETTAAHSRTDQEAPFNPYAHNDTYGEQLTVQEHIERWKNVSPEERNAAIARHLGSPLKSRRNVFTEIREQASQEKGQGGPLQQLQQQQAEQMDKLRNLIEKLPPEEALEVLDTVKALVLNSHRMAKLPNNN